jgi:dTDP-4-amino-4,6-dideoxygalactose transaminase/SAM-dependent methyltransferase
MSDRIAADNHLADAARVSGALEQGQYLPTKFAKRLQAPEPIPRAGIARAVRLMRTGRLYRYNFPHDLSDERPPAGPGDRDAELAVEVAILEHEFGRYTKHKYVVAVNSCGSAIFLALKATGVGPGDAVLTNAFTFTAVPSSIVHAGAVPVYVECNAGYVIDIEDLKRKIAARPDAKRLVLSYMRGHIPDLDAVQEICAEAGIAIIEDCAHSLGAQWDATLVGHHGEAACFSTQSYKLLNSGEGGLIATDNEAIAAYCILAAGSYEKLYKKHLARPRDDGLFEKLKPWVPNFSLRMSGLTAAVLRPQIRLLEDRIARGIRNHAHLAEILGAVGNIYIPTPLAKAQRAPDSLQFTLLGFTPGQVDRFVRDTGERGVAIQVFGRGDNSRYYRNWQYSFAETPNLEATEAIVSSTCDLRLPASLDSDDVNAIGYIVKDALYRALKKDERRDYPNGLTECFKNSEEVRSKYDAWVTSYDIEHYDNGWTVLLNYVAYTLLSYLRQDAAILDVGCGTGLLGRELRSYGFKELLGLDISRKSLDRLKGQGIYTALHRADLGQPLAFADNSFDALVSTGVFTRNQAPPESLGEMLRILKPGGIFAVALRLEDDGFYDRPIARYRAAQSWMELSRTRVAVLKSCTHYLLILQKHTAPGAPRNGPDQRPGPRPRRAYAPSR